MAMKIQCESDSLQFSADLVDFLEGFCLRYKDLEVTELQIDRTDSSRSAFKHVVTLGFGLPWKRFKTGIDILCPPFQIEKRLTNYLRGSYKLLELTEPLRILTGGGEVYHE